MRKSVSRSLSFIDCLALVVGLVLGIGIYQTSPIIAASVASPLEMYAIWMIGGLLTISGALCYAELASTYPKEGGDYFFLTRAYGGWAGFSYAWSQVFLIRPGSIAALSFPCSNYLAEAFPSYLSNMPESFIGILLILFLSALNFVSSTVGTRTQNLLSFLSYALLLALIIGGLSASPSAAANADVSVKVDYGLALILVLFCYGGWSELALVAGEIKNPGRTILHSMIVGVVLLALIYCAINYAFVYQLGFDGLRLEPAPAAHVIPGLPSTLVAALIAICALSSLNALIFSGARIGFAFGVDYGLFSWLGSWNERRNSPFNAILFQCLFSILFISLANSFTEVLVYTTAVVWFLYLGVGCALFVLRFKDKDIERPYMTWGYPLTPLIFCGSCVFLIYSAVLYDWKGALITLSFMLAGTPIYFLSRSCESKEKHSG